MEKFVIDGGVPLNGAVQIRGSKNASLPMLFASILSDEPVTVRNVPSLRDVDSALGILEELGVHSDRLPNGDLTLQVEDPTPCTAPYDRVRKMRASVCALGPLLARRGRARVSRPGGCLIGDRPIDLHLKGLAALGAEIRNDHGYIEMRADRLSGTYVYLGGPYGSTVTGTANVLMAATLAEGTTVIDAAACEPEIADLAGFLNRMGARIEGAGTPRIVVEGVEALGGTEYTVIPDRIEAGTFLVAGAATRGEVILEGVVPEHLGALLDFLRQVGVPVSVEGRSIQVLGHRAAGFRPADVSTLPYPGFPTDLQAQAVALLCLADGLSIVKEKVYPDRFIHIPELNRMAARIRKEGPVAIISGVDRLSGAPVMASDLRASASLVIAGLAAEGVTEVHRIYHIDRGYERIEERLNGLGARIERVPQEAAVAV